MSQQEGLKTPTLVNDAASLKKKKKKNHAVKKHKKRRKKTYSSCVEKKCTIISMSSGVCSIMNERKLQSCPQTCGMTHILSQNANVSYRPTNLPQTPFSQLNVQWVSYSPAVKMSNSLMQQPGDKFYLHKGCDLQFWLKWLKVLLLEQSKYC